MSSSILIWENPSEYKGLNSYHLYLEKGPDLIHLQTIIHDAKGGRGADEIA